MRDYELKPDVQYNELNANGKADWVDDFGGGHDLPKALGYPGYQLRAFEVVSGEVGWNMARVPVWLNFYLDPPPGARSSDTIKVEVKVPPRTFFWMFKRLNIVFQSRYDKDPIVFDQVHTVGVSARRLAPDWLKARRKR